MDFPYRKVTPFRVPADRVGSAETRGIEGLLPKFGPDGAWACPVPQFLSPVPLEVAQVRLAISRLPQPYSGVLRLHDGHRIPLATLARRLQAPPELVRQILHQARMALVALLANESSASLPADHAGHGKLVADSLAGAAIEPV